MAYPFEKSAETPNVEKSAETPNDSELIMCNWDSDYLFAADQVWKIHTRVSAFSWYVADQMPWILSVVDENTWDDVNSYEKEFSEDIWDSTVDLNFEEN